MPTNCAPLPEKTKAVRVSREAARPEATRWDFRPSANSVSPSICASRSEAMAIRRCGSRSR